MASPGNRHCANCIGTLSFHIVMDSCDLTRSSESRRATVLGTCTKVLNRSLKNVVASRFLLDVKKTLRTPNALEWLDALVSRVQVAYIFTARCYASAVLAMVLCPSVCPSVCLSVCLSVTSRCSTKTAKRRITQTTPHDSPGTLVFWRQRSPRNSTGVTPYEGAECRLGGSKSATFDQ